MTEKKYEITIKTIEDNHNYVCGLGGIHSENCRTRSTNADDRFNWEENTINTGNLAFHTINLPLIANESETIEEFYIKLTNYMDICKDSLLIRRDAVKQRLEDNKLPFLMWTNKDGKTLYNIDTTTLSIGFCGLNECILEMSDGREDMTTDDGQIFGQEILEYMNDYVKAAKKETGFKFGIFATPAESTAQRFAEINKKKHPDAYVQGKKGSYYLTNSSHIDVSSDANIIDHIKNADMYNKLTPFGSILHLWLGEKPTPDSLVSLTKKIKATNTGFWAYTLDFTVCNNCGQTYLSNISKCPNCNSEDVTVYSRITGYYLPVDGYNNGKKQEFEDRYRHKL